MQRPRAFPYALALVMTLVPAAGSFGQQGQQGGQQGQPQQGGQQGQPQQGGQQGQPQQGGQQGPQQGQPGANQQGQAGNPPSNQQGQPQGQPGNPNPQGKRPGNPRATQIAGHGNLKWDQILHNGTWQLAIAFVNEASRNSGMTLAPADAALRAHLSLANNEGLIVTALEPSSPAATAGIHQNDVLVSLAGESGPSVSLATPRDLEQGLRAHTDQPVSLSLLRGGQQMTLKVQGRVQVSLGPVHPEPPTYWIGVSVGPVEPALRSQLRIRDGRGLIAVDVVADGPAAKAGLRSNDILMAYDGIPLSDQAQLTRLVQARGEKAANVELVRQGRQQILEITPERRAMPLTVHFTEPQTNQYDILLPGATWRYNAYTGEIDQNRPGGDVVQGGIFGYSNNQTTPYLYYNVPAATGSPATDPTSRRLDELSAQIKELRQAVEALARPREKR